MAALAVQAVTKVFHGPVTALAGVDLEVEDGEFVGLIGPTGCGKTTLLRVIAGLEQVDQGRVLLGGQDATHLDPAARGVAMVFQDGALYPHLNVRENIGFPLRMEAGPASATAARIDQAARVTGVAELLAKRIGQLSGGERQRVALARALVRRPRALLLDEPLSNVDEIARADLRTAIFELTRRLGLGTLYVTHDQATARGLADRIVVLRGGRVEQSGPPAEVYADPASLFVAAFLGSPQTSLLAGAVYAEPEVATVVDLGDQAIRLPWSTPLARGLARHHGARVVVALRADAVSITSPATTGALSGRVTAIQEVGADIHAWLDIGGMPPALSPSELELVEVPERRALIPAQRAGESLRHAIGRLVPHGRPAPAPTARTSYGFYPVYDSASAHPEVNLTGTVVVRIPAYAPAPHLGEALTVRVAADRVHLFDYKGARLRG
jgi:multiple sugar transport system ATP-binding protein